MNNPTTDSRLPAGAPSGAAKADSQDPYQLTGRNQLPREERQKSDLPIVAHLSEILQAVDDHDWVLVCAALGAGKSTEVPKMLARSGYRSFCAQPTRAAAVALQMYVESQLGGTDGEIVGYKHGRGECIRPGFKVMYCSEAFLLEWLLSEKYLPNYSSQKSRDVFVLDELHKWSRHMEYLVALFNKYRFTGQVPKLLGMSGTIDPVETAHFLNGTPLGRIDKKIPIFQVPGRQFQITDRPRGVSRVDDVLDLVAEGRDVIDFHPGVGEIREAAKLLERGLRIRNIEAKIVVLHGKQAQADQQRAQERSVIPKIILATNVAETSLTIENVSAVVDGGEERISMWHEDEEILSLVHVSKGTQQQRRGRCGRTQDSVYINWGPDPESLSGGHWETQRIPCQGIILRLLVAGEDPRSLKLLHDPGPERREADFTWLKRHGFIDEHELPTGLGEFAARLPLEPRETKILYSGSLQSQVYPEMLGCLIDCAAVQSVRDFRESIEHPGPDGLRIPPLAPLIDPTLHRLMRSSESLAQVAALETIFRNESSAERQALFALHGIREAAVDEILLLREKIADRLGVVIAPLGARNLDKLPLDQLLPAVASNWGDHIYLFAGRDKRGNPLYRNVNDPNDPLRKLSRHATIGEPTLVTGKPFGVGITIESETSGAQILRVINNPCLVPRSWVFRNPNLRKLETQAFSRQQRERKEARLSTKRRH